MHANIETDADINANTDANTNVHAEILFRSFARGGLTSVRGQGRLSASNHKLKNYPWEWVAPHPFGIASSPPAPSLPSQGRPQRI